MSGHGSEWQQRATLMPRCARPGPLPWQSRLRRFRLDRRITLIGIAFYVAFQVGFVALIITISIEDKR